MPKKSARRLTEAGISRLPAAPEGERVEHADALAPGLVLRISDTGSKRWQVRFRVGGRAARMSLGAWPDLTLAEARKRAREVREQADAGVDPRDAREAEKRRAEAEARKEAEAARTFGDLAEAYVGRECSRLANGRELESLIRRELIPELGAVPLGDFRRRDMVRLLDRLMDAGQAAKARKLHWLGCRIFRWALGRDEIETDPLAGLPTPAAHRSRDRVLGDGELALLWEAWERQGFPFGSMGRLLLLTGARRSEVAEMRWRELDDGDDPALWTLPAERTKTGEARVIPLSSAARAVLAEVPRWALTGEFVFTTTAGRRPVSGFSRAKARTDRIAAEVAAERGVEPPEPWGLHDLRRTARTLLARVGVSDEVAERCIGHVGGSRLLLTYNRHKYESEMADAFERLASEVQRIAEGRAGAEIVALRR